MPGSWRAWILAACLACTALGQAAGQVGAGLRSILLTRPIWAPRQRLSRPRPQPLTWRLVTASSPSPPPRRGASMAWDADAGQLWLYGGELERARKNDTWMFSAADATWTPVLSLGGWAAAAPPPAAPCPAGPAWPGPAEPSARQERIRAACALQGSRQRWAIVRMCRWQLPRNHPAA